MGDSDSKELLVIEPNQLCFPFEAKKQISCSLQLRNITTECIAFQVRTTKPKSYCARPNIYVMPPRSTCDVTVTTKQALREVPTHMQCNDKFLAQSTAVMEETTIKDITLETFKKEAGNLVNEVKMRVVYVQPPGPLPPVLEGTEEGLSPRPSSSDGRDINYQDMHETRESNEPPLSLNLGARNEPGEITSEASSLTEPSLSSSTSDSKPWLMRYSESDSKGLLVVEPSELRFLCTASNLLNIPCLYLVVLAYADAGAALAILMCTNHDVNLMVLEST
uniref:Uncharacterized protein n=1 Tax=Avena sativa TaxID=4498 RepID=A0ACD6A3D1_AVESA